MQEIVQLEQAIAALNAQRGLLGDEVVDTAVRPLQEKLNQLLTQGAPLAPETPAPTSQPLNFTGEQRKQVTVLFADLVGFTSLSEMMDPEDVRDLTNAYFKRWLVEIERFGGVVEKFIGDAVMAVFGLRIASETDPENAIHAALAMRESLQQLRNAGEIKDKVAQLRMRIGIHTGSVVVSWLGERKGQDFVVVGDTVNLASRLQSLAPVNGILISHETYRLTAEQFEVQTIEPVLVKGKQEPVQAHIVLGSKKRLFRDSLASVQGIETTMIGRQAEQHWLLALQRESLNQAGCRVAIIIAEAGLGKTRLMVEFARSLQRESKLEVLKGRASPLQQHTPDALIHDIFAQRFNIQDNDPEWLVRQRLEQGIGDLVQAHFIARLLGFEIGKSEYLPEYDPLQVQQRGLSYIADYFRRQAGQAGIVFLLEDLHWADQSSLALLEQLIGLLKDVPVLFVIAGRPSLLEHMPQWGASAGAFSCLRLEPLSETDSQRLASEILQRVPELPPELTDLIVRSAEGVPYFVEELIKMLIEDGVIDASQTAWRIDRSRLADVRIPPTLTKLLQARFDSLQPLEKLLLQRAAVIGRTFWDQALAYLSLAAGGGVTANQQGQLDIQPLAGSYLQEFQPALYQLLQRELIFQREISSLVDASEYVFKHALLRDVTYESLLKRYRRLYHLYAAQWLEKIAGSSQRASEQAATIASHYELAGSQSEAARWYFRAAVDAASRYANTAALDLFERAMRFTPPADHRRRFVILIKQADIYSLLGDRTNQMRTLLLVQDFLDSLVASPEISGATITEDIHILSAVLQLRKAVYYNATGDYPLADQAAQQAVEWATLASDQLIEAQACLVWATSARYRSDYRLAINLLSRARELVERNSQLETATLPDELNPDEAGILRPSIRNLQAEIFLGLGVVADVQGEYDQARSMLEQALAFFRIIRYQLGESRALNSLGVVLSNQHDLAAARAYLEQALKIKRQMGDLYGEGVTLVNLGVLSERQHAFDIALDYFEQSLAVCKAVDDEEGKAAAWIGIGNNRQSLGDYPAARAAFDHALQTCRTIGDRQGEADILTSLGELHNVCGQAEQGRAYCLEAKEIAEQIGAPNEAGYAWYFLGRSEELLGNTGQAIQAYQRCLDLRLELGQQNLQVDARAGLARGFLAAGDLGSAQEQADLVLAVLHSPMFSELHAPVLACLSAWQVLRACGAPQAELDEILTIGSRFLNKVAGSFIDEGLRTSYQELVPENQQLRRLVDAAGLAG